MTTAEDLELATGPVQCKPWCREGDGHPFERYRANQGCSVSSEDLILSRLEPYNVGRPGTVELHPPFVEVTGYVDPGEAPFLCITAYHPLGEQTWEMTPDEARALGAQLVTIADTIEGRR